MFVGSTSYWRCSLKVATTRTALRRVTYNERATQYSGPLFSNSQRCYQNYSIIINWTSTLLLTLAIVFLPGHAMHKRGLCRHAVYVRPSVSLSVHHVHEFYQNKRIFKILSTLVSYVILVFPHQTSWWYSNGDPFKGASNAGGVGRHRDSESISGLIACCERCDRQVLFCRRTVVASCDTYRW